MRAQPSHRTGRGMKRTVLDYLLQGEPTLRRRRGWAALVIAAMWTTIAAADLRLWPGISLAFGYAIPIALGAYVFGIRVGVLLSVLGVVFRRVFAGRAYGPWWLYAGSALMLAEYLLLALGVGLLGRAIRRLERQTRVLRHLSEFGRHLTGLRDANAIWRMGVEGAVRLTGADGGFVATQQCGIWRTTSVFRGGAWREQSIIWLPQTPSSPEGEAGQQQLSVRSTDPPRGELDAPIQLGVALAAPDGGPRQLVIFRAVHGAFTPATSDVLKLTALHITAALTAAAGHGAAPPAVTFHSEPAIVGD